MDGIVKRILTARIYSLVSQTPLEKAGAMSRSLENHIYLKREDLQPVFSFKLRGAYNKILLLSDEEKKRGVIAASAGNHAQGVALSARHLGLEAVIVMPVTTPEIKMRAVRALGAQVVLEGESYQEAFLASMKIAANQKMTYIHPFDDPDVIAGQGTVGYEILQQSPGLDAVFVPVGGGGLIAGVGSILKELSPETRVIGVEPVDSDGMKRSLEAGRRISLERVGIFADGVAVKEVGEITFDLCTKVVDEIITVTTDEICSAIKLIYEDTRSIMEPAGALAVAGLVRYVQREGSDGRHLVAINSGANMNFDRLQFVTERTRTGAQKEALFAVTIPEKPGALRAFTERFVENRGVTEFNYRLSGSGEAHIFVGISTSDGSERFAYITKLLDLGYEAVDLTDNELAKVHIRHMVGGRSPHVKSEVIYRFHFPERRGALANFLNTMSVEWNISLFHYRMHGGDFGRVLIGMEIPPEERPHFQHFLDRLGYSYEEETENPAYRLFL